MSEALSRVRRMQAETYLQVYGKSWGSAEARDLYHADLVEVSRLAIEQEQQIAELQKRLGEAHRRIESIIEVAGHLHPADIRNAAFWIVAPPSIEVPRPEQWEIDARIAQRTGEVERVEKIIGLCLERHFGELKLRAEAAEAKLAAVRDVIESTDLRTDLASKLSAIYELVKE